MTILLPDQMFVAALWIWPLSGHGLRTSKEKCIRVSVSAILLESSLVTHTLLPIVLLLLLWLGMLLTLADAGNSAVTVHGPKNITHLMAACRQFVFRMASKVHTREIRENHPDNEFHDGNLDVYPVFLHPVRKECNEYEEKERKEDKEDKEGKEDKEDKEDTEGTKFDEATMTLSLQETSTDAVTAAAGQKRKRKDATSDPSGSRDDNDSPPSTPLSSSSTGLPVGVPTRDGSKKQQLSAPTSKLRAHPRYQPLLSLSPQSSLAAAPSDSQSQSPPSNLHNNYNSYNNNSTPLDFSSMNEEQTLEFKKQVVDLMFNTGQDLITPSKAPSMKPDKFQYKGPQENASSSGGMGVSVGARYAKQVERLPPTKPSDVVLSYICKGPNTAGSFMVDMADGLRVPPIERSELISQNPKSIFF
jgi:hypothetical protein